MAASTEGKVASHPVLDDIFTTSSRRSSRAMSVCQPGVGHQLRAPHRRAQILEVVQEGHDA
jgi:hypothetical protein